jgi:hypothetical protein
MATVVETWRRRWRPWWRRWRQCQW